MQLRKFWKLGQSGLLALIDSAPNRYMVCVAIASGSALQAYQVLCRNALGSVLRTCLDLYRNVLGSVL
jgi:hypothetical protein